MANTFIPKIILHVWQQHLETPKRNIILNSETSRIYVVHKNRIEDFYRYK